jgi:hypothetical protein
MLLGVAAYPFLFAVGATYVWLSERTEREFAELVDRKGAAVNHYALPAVALVTLATVAIGRTACGSRARRRISWWPRGR